MKNKIKDPTESAPTPVQSVNVEPLEKENYVPEGFDSKDDFLADMREEYTKDVEFDRQNREEALEDKKFTAGIQWDPLVLQARQGLPCLTINSVPQFLAQVVGDWRENKNGIKVVPSEDGDTDVASVRNDLIRAIQTRSRADRVYNSAFESMVQCGDGAYRIAVEYARDTVFDQEICIKPIDDCLSVIWDRFAVDPTGKDSRHVFVDDLMSEKEFKKKWPEKTPSLLGEDMRNQMRSQNWITEAGVKVTEYWRMVERQRLLGLFENGSTRIIEDNYEELVAQNGQVTKTRVAPVLYAQMHLVTGFDILAGPFEYKLNRVPIIRMTGRTVNVGGERIRHGLVRFMRDPVRLKNFWRSVAAEQLGYAPKAQWIAPQSAVEGREDEFRNAHLSRDPLLIYNDDAIAPPTRLDPPVPQAALLNEANVNAQDMKDVTGIHDASLGIKSNETSGRAIQARQREGDIANIVYYDNGNASIAEGGDVVNQLIPQVYDGTRVIRVIGEDEAVKFMNVNDPMDPTSIDLSIGQYDVVPTSGPSYSTRRVEAAQALMEAIQVWPQLIQVGGDIIAKAQDWPGSEKLADRLKKTIPPQFLEPEEAQESQGQYIDPAMFQQMQEQLGQIMQENQELKAGTAIKAKDLEIKAFEAETRRLDVVTKNQLSATQIGLKTITDAMNSPDLVPGPGSQKTKSPSEGGSNEPTPPQITAQ